jgi:hypothetical protein
MAMSLGGCHNSSVRVADDTDESVHCSQLDVNALIGPNPISPAHPPDKQGRLRDRHARRKYGFPAKR